MNSRVKNYLYLTIFIAFLGLAYNLYNNLSSDFQSRTEKQQQNDVNKENNSLAIAAPDFIVYDRQGREVKLSDFKGKPVVLNFWASWCPPCRREMPYFNQIYTEVGEEVLFMMVDLVDGQRETITKGKAYVDEQKYVFPIYFDNEQAAAQAYGVNSIPTTLFINQHGNIVKAYQGPINQDTLLAGISFIK